MHNKNNKKMYSVLFFALAVSFLIFTVSCNEIEKESGSTDDVSNDTTSGYQKISLPEPSKVGDVSLESILSSRRSVRSFKDEPISLDEVSQLLWAAQGVTGASGYRTAPSAGALYPLEVYICVDNVNSLESGIYKYIPEYHELMLVREGYFTGKLSSAALGQTCVECAPINIIITAVFSRTTERYSDRGINYVYIEAGHACQNVLLQASALNLGSVPVGAFRDSEVSQILNLPDEEEPLYIIPVGKPE